MLKSLSYSVEFPTTGRCFENQIEFAPGLTAITGRNEAGKTIVLEMVGYCLFGKAALRGTASDYKNLVANLALRVGDKEVVIDRARKETLTVDGEITAVGADAINKEIPKLLGFGLDVFNIACAAQQGDLDALTKLRPTERKQMIDKLIGLDLLENIEKDCKQEAKTHSAVASSLIVSVPVPQEPVRPDDYQPSADLEALVAEVQAHQGERALLLRVAEPVAPVAPEAPDVIDVEMLEAHEASRQAILRERAGIEGQLKAIPLPRVSRDELAGALAYAEYQQEVRRRGPKPDYTLDQLAGFEAILDAQDTAKNVEEVSCPACDHHFHPGVAEAVYELSLQTSPLNHKQIFDQQRRNALWDEPLAEVPAVVVDNIQQEVLAHARVDDRTGLQLRLDKLVVPADRGGELRAARAYHQARSVYDERAARYGADLAAYDSAQARLGMLPDRAADAVYLQGRLGNARAYEAAVERYQHDVARYDDVTARARDARDLSEGFSRGAASLKNVRVKVKAELAPSLSKAASTLISAMTKGERRFVDVDEDFNIIVDGQPLQTLSGSGKSVVNLALRLGLGQVLTSKVLPFFLGDEIDKDMDAVRAAATSETMMNLREYLSQIILVTHKEIEADHLIQV